MRLPPGVGVAAGATPRAGSRSTRCAVIGNVGQRKGSRRSRLLGWWYACIAVGFFLLALANALRGARPLMILLRVVIAAGFAALAHAEFRRQGR